MISGNGRHGLLITGAEADNHTVAGNLVSLGVTGLALGNTNNSARTRILCYFAPPGLDSGSRRP